jgi:hypothetical protein
MTTTQQPLSQPQPKGGEIMLIVNKVVSDKPEDANTYKVEYTRSVKTVDGKSAVIVDDKETKTVTVGELEFMRTVYVKKIEQIDAELLQIKKLTQV